MIYDVNGDDAGIEVDGQALQADVGADALRTDAHGINGQSGGYGVCNQDLAGWIVLWRDVVEQNVLQELLGWLRSLVRDFIESTVYWGKNGVIGDGPIEKDDKIGIFVDGSSKLGGVFAGRDQLVNGLVGLVVMMIVKTKMSVGIQP